VLLLAVSLFLSANTLHTTDHTEMNITRLSDGVTGHIKIEISNIDIDTFTGTSYWYNL